MDAFELNKEILIKLWEDRNKIKDEKEYNNVLKTWEDYKNKIVTTTSDQKLKLDEYTNLKIKKEDEYLLNFLERTSKIFGTSRGGNSNQYMLKRNNDKKKVSFYIKDGKTITTEASKTDADKYYSEKILPLYKKIVEADENTLNILEKNKYEGYEATQILRKMVVLSNTLEKKYDYLYIFKEDTVDELYKKLCDEDSDLSFYEKSKAVFKSAKEIIQEDFENSLSKNLELSSVLWQFENLSYDDFPSDEAPNVIFYGAPGTGKTYIVNQYLKFNNIKPENCVFVQFHPSYTYEDFIDGIKPTGISQNGSIKLELCNGLFKDLCIKAKNDISGEKYFFIADEINRANLSNVFGETLSLLEADYRDNPPRKDEKENSKKNRHTIKLQNSKLAELSTAEKYEDDFSFGIPKNVYFIGMMNDVDKSIDSFDLALRRRFKWVRKECDYDVIEKNINKIDVEDYVDSCKKLNEYISGITDELKVSNMDTLKLGKSYEFGHSFFLKIDKIAKNKITKQNKVELFENYLRPTLKEYLRSFYDELEIEAKLTNALKLFCE